MDKTLLIADDEEALRALYELNYLAGFEGNKVFAHDGSEAVSKLEELIGGNGLVVITDVQMPRMDGWQVLKHIKQHYPSVPVIIASVNDDPEYITTARELGAHAFLKKGGDDFRARLEKSVEDAYSSKKD